MCVPKALVNNVRHIVWLRHVGGNGDVSNRPTNERQMWIFCSTKIHKRFPDGPNGSEGRNGRAANKIKLFKNILVPARFHIRFVALSSRASLPRFMCR